MELRFHDLTDYFHHPPKLESLQGETKDCRRRKRGEVLLIIPSYHDSKRLKRMLDGLARQSFKKFDIAIIYASDDKFVPSRRLPIIHVRRKIDLGYAGAVYLGQLLALKYGYKYYLATDVDKYPASRDSLKLLYDAAERNGADYVGGRFVFLGMLYPKNRFFDLEKPVQPTWEWEFVWCLLRSSTLLSTGLYPLPLYLGCDEVEFEYRMRLCGIRRLQLDKILYGTYLPCLKFFSLISQGGFDNTYHYQNYLSMVHMPQIFLHRFQSPRAALLVNLSHFLLYAIYYFLGVHLRQRFLEARIPAMTEYRKRVRQCAFGYISCGGPAEDFTISKTSFAAAKPELQVSLNPKLITQSLVSFLEISASPPSSAMDFSLFSNKNTVSDAFRRRAFSYRWKRQISLLEKSTIFSLSLCDMASALARALVNSLLRREHIFKGYGVGVARETLATRCAERSP